MEDLHTIVLGNIYVHIYLHKVNLRSITTFDTENKDILQHSHGALFTYEETVEAVAALSYDEYVATREVAFDRRLHGSGREFFFCVSLLNIVSHWLSSMTYLR